MVGLTVLIIAGLGFPIDEMILAKRCLPIRLCDKFSILGRLPSFETSLFYYRSFQHSPELPNA